jgi:Tfp pilus assembly protein PilV
MSLQYLNKNSGQSLFEVLFTLAIAALLITGIVSLATTSIGNSTFSETNTKATKYAEELNEWLRSERDYNWNIFLNNVQGSSSYCFNGSSITWGNIGNCLSSEFIAGTNLLRQAIFVCYDSIPLPPTVVSCSGVNVDTVQASITVSWTDNKGSHNANVISRLSKWQEE